MTASGSVPRSCCSSVGRGSGKRELLRLWIEHGDGAVVGLPGVVLARTADLLKACEQHRAAGAHTFVVEAGLDPDWNHLASVLLPGERIVSATNVYESSEALEAWGRVGVLLPNDLLLRREEARELVRGGVGAGDTSDPPIVRDPSEIVDRLWRWSGGWLEPLRPGGWSRRYRRDHGIASARSRSIPRGARSGPPR